MNKTVKSPTLMILTCIPEKLLNKPSDFTKRVFRELIRSMENPAACDVNLSVLPTYLGIPLHFEIGMLYKETCIKQLKKQKRSYVWDNFIIDLLNARDLLFYACQQDGITDLERLKAEYPDTFRLALKIHAGLIWATTDNAYGESDVDRLKNKWVANRLRHIPKSRVSPKSNTTSRAKSKRLDSPLKRAFKGAALLIFGLAIGLIIGQGKAELLLPGNLFF